MDSPNWTGQWVAEICRKAWPIEATPTQSYIAIRSRPFSRPSDPLQEFSPSPSPSTHLFTLLTIKHKAQLASLNTSSFIKVCVFLIVYHGILSPYSPAAWNSTKAFDFGRRKEEAKTNDKLHQDVPGLTYGCMCHFWLCSVSI